MKYIGIGDISGKTLGEVKSIVINEISQAAQEGFSEVKIRCSGNLLALYKYMNDDTYIIQPSGIYTLEASNMTTTGAYAHIEIYSYYPERVNMLLYNGSISTTYISNKDIPLISSLQTKLSSLEARIQALENK